MPSPYPLADLFGEPRPIELAGRSYWIAPLRVRDLAALGAFATGRRPDPDPIEAARSLPADAPAEERAAALKAAQDFADAPPPDPGSPGYRDVSGSADGLTWTVYVALRRHNPDFGMAEAGDLVAALIVDDPGGIGRLIRRAYAKHPAQAFLDLVDPQAGDGKPIDWPILIDRLSWERGWTYEEVADMTLPAFWSALRHGEAPKVEYRPRPGESREAHRARIKAMLGLG